MTVGGTILVVIGVLVGLGIAAAIVIGVAYYIINGMKD